MSSYIEIISTLKQKNNLDFPIVDSNDIKGGLYLVNNVSERNSIPILRRKEGMVCWVKDDGFYQLIGGIENINWKEITLSGGGGSLNRSDVEWIGSQTPTNQDVIWFDPSDDGVIEVTNDNPLIQELKSTIKLQNDRILKLEEMVEYILLNLPNSDNSPTDGIYLTLEDGTNLLLEDGTFILLESI